MDHPKLKTYGTSKELESATGERFETYAQFLLNLIHPNYIGTRIHKDGGVDGMILCREIPRRKPPTFYSIHGPERTTGWANKFRKLKEDVANIKQFSSGLYTTYSIVFVLNYRVAGTDAVGLHAFMEQEGIPYSLFDPDRLIGSLTTGSQIQRAVSFIDGIAEEERELTDWNNHIFAGKVLEGLMKLPESEDLSEKMAFILQLRGHLITYLAPIDFIMLKRQSSRKEYGENAIRLFVVPNARALCEQTQVNQGCRTVYLVHEKKQKIQRLTESDFENMYDRKFDDQPLYFHMGEQTVGIKIENLAVIYDLLSTCYHLLEQTGDFSLQDIIGEKVAQEIRREQWRKHFKGKSI